MVPRLMSRQLHCGHLPAQQTTGDPCVIKLSNKRWVRPCSILYSAYHHVHPGNVHRVLSSHQSRESRKWTVARSSQLWCVVCPQVPCLAPPCFHLGSALHFLFLRGTIELCYISFREMTLKVEARLDWPIDSFDLISLVIINSYFRNIL